MIATVFGLAPRVVHPGRVTKSYRGLDVVVPPAVPCATLVTLTFAPSRPSCESLRARRRDATPACAGRSRKHVARG
jgi:hypothetical protein